MSRNLTPEATKEVVSFAEGGPAEEYQVSAPLASRPTVCAKLTFLSMQSVSKMLHATSTKPRSSRRHVQRKPTKRPNRNRKIRTRSVTRTIGTPFNACAVNREARSPFTRSTTRDDEEAKKAWISRGDMINRVELHNDRKGQICVPSMYKCYRNPVSERKNESRRIHRSKQSLERRELFHNTRMSGATVRRPENAKNQYRESHDLMIGSGLTLILPEPA